VHLSGVGRTWGDPGIFILGRVFGHFHCRLWNCYGEALKLVKLLTSQVRISPSCATRSITSRQGWLMTHKYRGCIVVLSINKSVEPNEEQKVLMSSFD
jgi:hypothetical protein